MELREGGDHLRRVLAAGVGEQHRTVHPVKQHHAELVLEQPHLMAYRRRGDRELVCCKCERAKPGRRLKRLNCLDGKPHGVAPFR